MLMPEVARKSAVFLYRSAKAAKEDDFEAMGFFVARESKRVSGQSWPYLVTNHHVVKGLKAVYARINRQSGGFEIQHFPKEWFVCDEKFDLAIAPVKKLSTLDAEIYHVSVKDFIEDWRDDPNKLWLGSGDELVMPSRIIGQKIRYKKRNIVALRFGSISLCPEHEELCFVAEMRSVPGHSGSPVFVYSVPPFSALRPNHPPVWTKLLGINRGHLRHYDSVVSVRDVVEGKADVKRPSHLVATNMSMSQVVPAWKIRELLYCQELCKQYEKNEEALAPGIGLDSSAAGAS